MNPVVTVNPLKNIKIINIEKLLNNNIVKFIKRGN
jgi:hypothetical protein